VFGIFSVAILFSLFALPFLRAQPMASKAELQESLGTVLLRAFKDPSYAMIFMGFFSCGYQLAFLTAHFPAFITERCGGKSGRDHRVATLSIAVKSLCCPRYVRVNSHLRYKPPPTVATDLPGKSDAIGFKDEHDVNSHAATMRLSTSAGC
jgi:hypothetical protein